MIRISDWDTGFFKKKMGVLELDDSTPTALADDLEAAKNERYEYVICHLKSPEAKNIHLLESHGFYLADVGVTWFIEIDKFATKPRLAAPAAVATTESIPGLKELARSMFVNSRFYSDPFFSKEEADNLHEAWVENSVLGKAANIVFLVEGKGFITCKLVDGIGEIALIGVKEGCRGEGIGLSLIDSSVSWFTSRRTPAIRVKTQLKNIGAMNFYRKLGFSILSYDMAFARII